MSIDPSLVKSFQLDFYEQMQRESSLETASQTPKEKAVNAAVAKYIELSELRGLSKPDGETLKSQIEGAWNFSSKLFAVDQQKRIAKIEWAEAQLPSIQQAARLPKEQLEAFLENAHFDDSAFYTLSGMSEENLAILAEGGPKAVDLWVSSTSDTQFLMENASDLLEADIPPEKILSDIVAKLPHNQQLILTGRFGNNPSAQALIRVAGQANVTKALQKVRQQDSATTQELLASKMGSAKESDAQQIAKAKGQLVSIQAAAQLSTDEEREASLKQADFQESDILALSRISPENLAILMNGDEKALDLWLSSTFETKFVMQNAPELLDIPFFPEKILADILSKLTLSTRQQKLIADEFEGDQSIQTLIRVTGRDNVIRALQEVCQEACAEKNEAMIAEILEDNFYSEDEKEIAQALQTGLSTVGPSSVATYEVLQGITREKEFQEPMKEKIWATMWKIETLGIEIQAINSSLTSEENKALRVALEKLTERAPLSDLKNVSAKLDQWESLLTTRNATALSLNGMKLSDKAIGDNFSNPTYQLIAFSHSAPQRQSGAKTIDLPTLEQTVAELQTMEADMKTIHAIEQTYPQIEDILQQLSPGDRNKAQNLLVTELKNHIPLSTLANAMRIAIDPSYAEIRAARTALLNRGLSEETIRNLVNDRPSMAGKEVAHSREAPPLVLQNIADKLKLEARGLTPETLEALLPGAGQDETALHNVLHPLAELPPNEFRKRNEERYALLKLGLYEQNIPYLISLRPSMKGQKVTHTLEADAAVLGNIQRESELQRLGLDSGDIATILQQVDKSDETAIEKALIPILEQLRDAHNYVTGHYSYQEQTKVIDAFCTNLQKYYQNQLGTMINPTLHGVQHALGAELFAKHWKQMTSFENTVSSLRKLGFSDDAISTAILKNLPEAYNAEGSHVSLDSLRSSVDLEKLPEASKAAAKQLKEELTTREKKCKTTLTQSGVQENDIAKAMKDLLVPTSKHLSKPLGLQKGSQESVFTASQRNRPPSQKSEITPLQARVNKADLSLPIGRADSFSALREAIPRVLFVDALEQVYKNQTS